MGSYTDSKIAAFQEATGIKPTTGKYDEHLEAISQAAYEIIKTIAHERTGIGSGDGCWYGGDVMSGLLDNITIAWRAALRRQDKEWRAALKKQGRRLRPPSPAK